MTDRTFAFSVYTEELVQPGWWLGVRDGVVVMQAELRAETLPAWTPDTSPIDRLYLNPADMETFLAILQARGARYEYLS